MGEANSPPKKAIVKLFRFPHDHSAKTTTTTYPASTGPLFASPIFYDDIDLPSILGRCHGNGRPLVSLGRDVYGESTDGLVRFVHGGLEHHSV